MCSIAMTVLRITGQLRALLLTSAVYAVITLGLALLGARHGLQWVAVAYLLGTTAAGLLAAKLAAVRLHARSEPGDTHPVPR